MFSTIFIEQGRVAWKKSVGSHKYSEYSEATIYKSNQNNFVFSLFITINYKDYIIFQQ